MINADQFSESERETFDEQNAPVKFSEKELSENPTPLKVSDDSKSTEILVFTSHQNVCKVQRKEIHDKFQALQKIDLEEGEKPIYLTGEKNYAGFLIVAFENGKIAKISMDSYKTEFKRKKLKNAYNGDSKLIFIERFSNDVDLVTLSSIKKVVLFNTSQINAVGSRTAMGVQVMKEKNGSIMVKVKKAAQTKLADPEYYRKSDTLNVVGYYLKPDDEL